MFVEHEIYKAVAHGEFVYPVVQVGVGRVNPRDAQHISVGVIKRSTRADLLIAALIRRTVQVADNGRAGFFGCDVPGAFARVEIVNPFVRKRNDFVVIGFAVLVDDNSRTNIPAFLTADKSRRVEARVVPQNFGQEIFDVCGQILFALNFGRYMVADVGRVNFVKLVVVNRVGARVGQSSRKIIFGSGKNFGHGFGQNFCVLACHGHFPVNELRLGLCQFAERLFELID